MATSAMVELHVSAIWALKPEGLMRLIGEMKDGPYVSSTQLGLYLPYCHTFTNHEAAGT